MQAYDSKPVPFSIPSEKYRQGTRDVVYLLDDPRISRSSIGLTEAIGFIADDNPATKLQQAENAAYLPKKVLSFKIDKEAVIRNKAVRPEDYDKIVDTITIDLSNRNYIAKDEMMILDLLATNNWERPVYWAITVGSSKYMGLQDYFQTEGFAYRFVPVKGQSSPQSLSFGTVATDLMYDNLMNKFEYGNMNDPDIYIDENNVRMMTNIRNSFNRLASALISEGKKDSAVAVIDRCLELIPNEIVQYEYFAMELAESYFKAGAVDKGKAMVETAFGTFDNELGYYLSLDRKLIQTQDVNEEIQRNMFYLQKMERMVRNSGDTELAKKIADSLQAYFEKFNAA
jgi:tetratricopeptide (TPR) repeat protein